MAEGLTEGQRAEIARMITEAEQRIGIFASDPPSLKRTQRNTQFLDRAAEREDEDRANAAWIKSRRETDEEDRANMAWVKARREAELEGRKEFRRGVMGKAGEWIISLIGTIAAGVAGWFLARGH